MHSEFDGEIPSQSCLSDDDRLKLALTSVGGVSLDSISSSEINWLWPGRIPLGSITLLAGDPGVGKSVLALDIAARVTRGAPWPDAESISSFDIRHSSFPPASVLLTVEDGLSRVVRPRLEAAGADCSRITAVPMTISLSRTTNVSRGFELRRDLKDLRNLIKLTPDCRLVLIDSAGFYLSEHSDRAAFDVPLLLLRLAAVAAESNIAVLVIAHFRKKSGLAIHRTMGSLAFVAAARVAWAVIKDQNDPSRRLLLSMKNNLSTDAPGLAFTIESAANQNAPRIHWLADYADSSPAAVFSGPTRIGRPDDERQHALAWLQEQLASGARPMKEIRQASDANGIAYHTLRRAFRDLHGKATKSDTPHGPWLWQLPVKDAQNPGETCGHL